MVVVDTNMILDVLERQPNWWQWSIQQMRQLSQAHVLTINPIIYAELAPSHSSVDALDRKIATMNLVFEYLPREATFFAGKAYLKYRQQGGTKTNVLSDFFIGAHAQAEATYLLTRDPSRYKTYFPTVRLITP